MNATMNTAFLATLLATPTAAIFHACAADAGNIGLRVKFQDWDDLTGERIWIRGVVMKQFREPASEDPHERLNFNVRADDGSHHTPYAHECAEDYSLDGVM